MPKPLLFLKVCFYAAPIVLDYCGSSIIKGWTTPVYSIRYAILANLRDSVNLHARYESVSCVRQVVGCRWQVGLVGLALESISVESSRVESSPCSISAEAEAYSACAVQHTAAPTRSARLGSARHCGRTLLCSTRTPIAARPPARPLARDNRVESSDSKPASTVLVLYILASTVKYSTPR